MSWDSIQRLWRQLRGARSSRQRKAPDEDASTVARKRRMLVGKLQEHYGVLKDEAEKQLDGWLATLSSRDVTHESGPGKVDKRS